MGAPSSSEDQTWTCTACGGAYAIVGSRERAGVRLKCIDCGSSEDAVLTRRNEGAWVLADPEGRVSFATSRRELVEMETGANVRGRAASLLEGASTGDTRRISLLPTDDEREATTPRRIDPDMTPIAPSMRDEGAEEELPSTELLDAPPSNRDLVAAAAADAVPATDPEPSDVTAFVESERVPAAKPAEDEGEKVSLRDVVVVKDTPAAPRAGALKTLPPMGRPSAPPPPTIDVASAATKAKGKSSTPPPAAARESVRPSAAPAAEPKNRTYTYVAVGAAAVAVWLGVRAFGSNDTAPITAAADRGAPTASTAEPSATAAPEPAPTASAEPVASASAAPVASAAPTTTTAAAASAPPADVKLASTTTAPAAATAAATTSATPTEGAAAASPAQLLDKAGAARRAGNLDKARELYTQVLREKAGDVEAHSGLGEVARMSGDLETARDHYRAALQSSPSFYPALLGLADATWDLGDKTEGTRLYAKILAMRDNVPDRVKERGGAPKPAPKPDEATE